MNPDVNSGDGQKRLKACGNPLPTHHQAAVFLLEPGKRPLGLESRHHFLDRSASIFLGLPDLLRDVRPNPTLPQLLAERFRIIALIRCEDLEAVAGTAPFTSMDLDRSKQREHLG